LIRGFRKVAPDFCFPEHFYGISTAFVEIFSKNAKFVLDFLQNFIYTDGLYGLTTGLRFLGTFRSLFHILLID
jgi:hypothetical protein